MKSKLLNFNKNFIGRAQQWQRLEKIGEEEESAIVILYGRRRIGKTELLEQVYRTRNIIKFEGIESKSEQEQRYAVMVQLAEYTEEPLLAEIKPTNWTTVFKHIARYITKGKWTLYFEEVQWLADYKSNFIAELKYVWDNEFRYNNQLIVILCGSSPSFMINYVVQSKALYNRSQHEIQLNELNLIDTRAMLAKNSIREVLDAYLTVGGIPEYLKRLNKGSSIFINLCNNSFTPNAYFATEYKRIFASSMAENKHYSSIIELLGKRKFATRPEIAKNLQIQQGGSLTNLLNDLEVCGFIQKYSPYNLNEQTKLARFCINDAYLNFYYKFIKPIQSRIDNGSFEKNPVSALKTTSYQKWLGFAFERFCRKYHTVIASILGFSGIDYNVGPFYNKNTNALDPNFQIDLIFDRADGVYTICEIKYLQTKLGTHVIEEMERKIELLSNPKNKTIHRVIISKEGIDDALTRRHYFDNIITIEQLFDDRYW